MNFAVATAVYIGLSHVLFVVSNALAEQLFRRAVASVRDKSLQTDSPSLARPARGIAAAATLVWC